MHVYTLTWPRRTNSISGLTSSSPIVGSSQTANEILIEKKTIKRRRQNRNLNRGVCMCLCSNQSEREREEKKRKSNLNDVYYTKKLITPETIRSPLCIVYVLFQTQCGRLSTIIMSNININSSFETFSDLVIFYLIILLSLLFPSEKNKIYREI